MGSHQIPLFRKVAIATKNAIERAEGGFGLPTVYQAHFWLSKLGSNSVPFLSMVQAT